MLQIYYSLFNTPVNVLAIGSSALFQTWKWNATHEVSVTIQTTWYLMRKPLRRSMIGCGKSWRVLLQYRAATIQCKLELLQLSNPSYVPLCIGFEVKGKKLLITILGSVQAPVWYWLVWPAFCSSRYLQWQWQMTLWGISLTVLMQGERRCWKRSLPNKQVTFLVYREGDQLNFFRVVDRGDGTLTPVSESLRSVQRREITCQEDNTLHSGSLF